MVLVGYRKWAILLGSKMEECLKCGAVGLQALVRITWWGTLFFVPIILFRFQHAMVCQACGEVTGIPVLQMLRGIRTGRLPLARTRPQFEAAPPDASGFKPLAADYFDPVRREPKRSIGGWYFLAWPFLVGLLVVALVGARLTYSPPKTPLGQQIDTRMEDRYGPAHDCWVAENDTENVAGCRLSDGSTVGEEVGRLTICYFHEPVASDVKLHCRD